MKRQRGFVWWVYAIVAAVLIGIGTTVVITYNSAIAAKEKAKADLQTVKETLEATNTALAVMTKDKEALDKQLVQRRNTSNVIKQQVIKEITIIETAKAENKEIISWAATPVPIDLLNRLRDSDTSKTNDNKTDSSIGIPDTGKDTIVEGIADSDK